MFPYFPFLKWRHKEILNIAWPGQHVNGHLPNKLASSLFPEFAVCFPTFPTSLATPLVALAAFCASKSANWTAGPAAAAAGAASAVAAAVKGPRL